MSENEDQSSDNNAAEENAFEAPKADLSSTNTEKPILEIERFSTWGVFFLGMFTLGIYSIYWLYSRTQTINCSAQENKVSTNLLNTYIGSIILVWVISIYGGFTAAAGDSNIEMVSSIITIINYIIYLVLIFAFRRAVTEVINMGTTHPVKLGGVMTFFFSVLYFQYKINEAIDEQSQF